MKARPVTIAGRSVFLVAVRQTAAAAARLAGTDDGLRYTCQGGKYLVYRPIDGPKKNQKEIPI